MLGFCVHRIGDIVKSPDTQMLQPMHSRIVSSLPSRILFGRNGSAIEGRAAPMRSRMPRLHLADHHVRRGEPADADDGLAGQLLQPGDVLLLLAFRAEPGGDGVFLPRAHHEVPQVGQLAELAEDLLDVSAAQARVARVPPRR